MPQGLKFFNKADRMRTDAFKSACKAEFFFGSGFYVDIINIGIANIRNDMCHFINVWRKFGLLCNNGSIDINNLIAFT